MLHKNVNMQNCLEGQLSKEEIEQKFTQKREETEGGKKKGL